MRVKIKDDWKYIADILDRLMLLIFLVVTFVGTYNFLLDLPAHIFETIDQQNLIKVNSQILKKPSA